MTLLLLPAAAAVLAADVGAGAVGFGAMAGVAGCSGRGCVDELASGCAVTMGVVGAF
jgi:hypothetical protein